MNTKKRSSASVMFGITSALALTMTGCANTGEPINPDYARESMDSDYARICVDEQTQNRVEDDKCSTDQTTSNGGVHTSFIPFFIPLGSSNVVIPPVGSSVSKVQGVRQNNLPASSKVTNVDSKGSNVVSRGGFGAKGGGAGS